MSEPASELPPVRFPPNDPWSGLPRQDAAAPGRPLTYGERDVLRAFLRFRDQVPPQSWLLLRGAASSALMLVVFGVLVGLLWGGVYFSVALGSELQTYDPDATEGWEGLFALAIWLGLTYGFLVRDQIDLRQTVSAWHIVQRVIKFDTAERLLESGTMSPESNDQGAKEARR